MRIKSGAFSPEGKIPERYTCQGENISPEISWEGAPEKTQTFALILDDSDAPAGAWVHWVVYNIPGAARGLPPHVPATERLENDAVQGRNSFRKIGYGGPCPPQGHGPHRYFFRLYALDARLNLKPGAGKEEVMSAMNGHILGEAGLMGRFERPL
jgi:hypothetical protein